MSVSQFTAGVDAEVVARVTSTGHEVTGVTKSNVRFQTRAPVQFEGFGDTLDEKGVREPAASGEAR